MVKKRGRPLTELRRYEDFIKSRDRVLESILRKYLRALDRAVDYLRDCALEIVARHHVGNADLYLLKRSLSSLEHRIDQLFDPVERDIVTLIYRLRGTTYGLSHVGQAEAILRVTGEPTKFDLAPDHLKAKLSAPTRAGAPIEHRAWMAIERLKRKIIDAYQTGILFDDTTEDMIDRISAAFPRPRFTKRGPKPLKHPKLSEADGEGITAIGISKKKPEMEGQIDPELWTQIVDDYLSTEIPFYPSRAPRDEEAYYEEHGQYEWELEKETTQEFVDQVRSGEIEAANKNGITDFLVLAVLDSKTDECCIARDGMTITEIEEALDSGKLDDDVCDGTVPPFHFNCRCRIAPMSDDIPETPPPNWGEFDEWLSTKAGT